MKESVSHCNALQHNETYCKTMQHTVAHCHMLQHAATRCNTLQHAATHCSMLQHAATLCSMLQHTAPHKTLPSSPTRLVAHMHESCNTCEAGYEPLSSVLIISRLVIGKLTLTIKSLSHAYTSHVLQMQIQQRFATTHCNTLQHTATHCNTLQHTATHCNTLPK